MINSIIDGVSEAIFNEFGEEYAIYTESVEQGLKTPCFFILSAGSGLKQYLGKRYTSANKIIVQYKPNGLINDECNTVMQRLFKCLEYITVDGDLVRGLNLTGERTEDVLYTNVDYDMFVYVDTDAENVMEALKIQQRGET